MTAPSAPLVFGEARLCRICHGTGKKGEALCVTCGGRGVEAERTRSVEEGRALRDAAMESVEEREPDWSERASAWIGARMPDEIFTADDLTRAIGHPDRRAAVGPAFAAAARRREIERAGLAQSELPDSHASIIQKWRRR